MQPDSSRRPRPTFIPRQMMARIPRQMMACVPVAALLVGFLTVLAGCGATSTAATTSGSFQFDGATPAGQVISQDERQSAPGFSGELLDGTPFDSADLDGDIVVINFWGSWCAPCRIETPEFQQVFTEVRDSEVSFLGIDVRDERQLASAFYADNGIEYPSLFDPRSEVALAFRGFPANAVPSTILLDRQGRVAAVFTAAVAGDDLRAALSRLLEES